MFRGKKVVVCIPAGRERYMSALMPYLLNSNSREIVDHVDIWVNTDVESDLKYFERLESESPGYVRRVFGPGETVRQVYDQSRAHYQYSSSICRFFPGATDYGTIYFKLDDDICYIHPKFFRNMCDELLERSPNNLIVLGNVFNIPITSYQHQQRGVIPHDIGMCDGTLRDNLACKSGEWARAIHLKFLELESAGRLDELMLPSRELTGHQRIGAMCWRGGDFAEFGGRVEEADEISLTRDIAARLGKPHKFCGDGLVSHFAFSHQRAVLEDQTDTLRRYIELAHRLNP
jgi:hypothetical protein